MLEIRRIDADDIDEALDLAESVYNKCVAPTSSEQGNDTFHGCIACYRIFQGIDCWGAYEDGEIVGMIATRNEISHITLFFVKYSKQGCGVGRKLFEGVLSESGARCITVHATPSAVGRYVGLGFEATDGEKEDDGIKYLPMKYTRSE